MSAKVLVIDDSKFIHSVIAVGLAGEEVELLHAYDAELGFRIAFDRTPDVILLDVILQDSTGFEVCKRLKNESQTAHIPVIFLSGSGDTVDKVNGLDLGAIDYITKPFEAAELQARVRAALRTKQLVDMLATLAKVDALTGLHNRQYFQERWTEAVGGAQRYARPVGLVLLDVDHFKKCNDTYGHPFGDRVLQTVADVLRRTVRDVDAACRYGGEEFALILPETDLPGTVRLAERARCALMAEKISSRNEPVQISASFGAVSTSTADDLKLLTPLQLLQAADDALYRAKRGGRNRVEAATLSCELVTS